MIEIDIIEDQEDITEEDQFQDHNSNFLYQLSNIFIKNINKNKQIIKFNKISLFLYFYFFSKYSTAKK